MRKFIFFSGLVISGIAGYAQTNNALQGGVMVTTSSSGEVYWNVEVNGTTRRGVVESKNTDRTALNDFKCWENKADKVFPDADEIVPVTSNLYPLESTDMLYFSGNGKDLYQVSIMNEEGKMIKTYSYHTDHSLDISELTEGVYLIEISQDNSARKISRKIVKD